MKTKFTLFGLLLAAAVVWLLPWDRSPETDHALASETGASYTAPQEPGWYKEWFEVRKNAQGVIPRGLRQQWAAHDARRGTSRSTLLGTVWELGPDTAGGRTRALMANAANPGEFLAGGASGGLWYTVNGGTYWHPVDDQASTLMVSGITQNLLNPTEVYYCTGEGWGPAGPVPGDGIFKSTNGGASFTQLASTTTGDFDLCWDIVHSRVLHDLVLVGTHSGGIWRTTDGGTTWTNVMVASQRVNDLIALPNGDFFAGVNGSGIFRSVDHGTTWTKITAGLPSGGFQRIALGFSEGSPDVIYAAMAQGSNTMLGIYKSTDGGGTWAPTGPLPTLSNSFTSYCLFIGVSEHNPEHVVYGAQYSYYSLDGGGTWTRNFGGHPDYHSYMDDPSDPDYFFLGTDGGIYRKSWASMATRGQNWNNGYHVTQFYAGDYLDSGIRAIGGTQDNGPQLGIDGGWRILSLADGGYAQVSLQDTGLVYTETQFGGISRYEDIYDPSSRSIAIDGGITDASPFIAPFEVNRADGDQLYFCSNSRLWRTTNRGDNWQALTPTDSRFNGVGVTKDMNPRVYAVGRDGHIIRINSAKTTGPGIFADLDGSVPAAINTHSMSDIKPDPTNPTKAYVTLTTIDSASRIWRLDNSTWASPTWVDISGDLPVQLPINTMEVDPTNNQRMYAGTDFGLYVTSNGGTNWNKATEIPNVPVMQLQLRESDRKLFLFTHGRGVWMANIDGPGVLPQAYTTLPYSTGFESGLDMYWATGSSNPDGRVELSHLHGPHSGSSHLLMDQAPAGPLNTNRADLHLDLTGATEVELRFWFKEFSDEFHAEDGVFLSDDGGATFTKILPLSGTGTYVEYVVDVDAEAMAHGLSLTATTVIRFQQHDNSTISGDGFAFDDINVHVPPGSRLTSVPSIPTETARELSLYPNPARDQVVLAVAGAGADQPATVTFYGLDGRMVRQQRLSATGPNGSHQLDIADLPAGTYLVEVTSGTYRDVLRLVKP